MKKEDVLKVLDNGTIEDMKILKGKMNDDPSIRVMVEEIKSETGPSSLSHYELNVKIYKTLCKTQEELDKYLEIINPRTLEAYKEAHRIFKESRNENKSSL